MKESMPDVSFERSMNHNYMILSKCSFFGKGENQARDYRTKMILGNRIPGLLPITHRLVNGESRYYYEINSLQSLDRLYDKTEIRYDELRRLLSGCVKLFDRLEEYLLDGTQIIMKPELIYMNVERMEPYFVCYPDYEGDVRLSFMEFIDELLTKIDHTDERAVMLGYQIYRYTRNPNYVISEIGNMMDHVIVNMAHRNQDSVQADSDLPKEISCDSGKSYMQSSCTNQRNAKNNLQDMGNPKNPGHFVEQTYEVEEDIVTAGQSPGDRIKNIRDLAGGLFCIFVSLCMGAVILAARTTHAFRLGGNKELYLYGAMGMALMAAVLFFVCHVSRRRQNKDIGLAEDEEDDEALQYYTTVGETPDTHRASCYGEPQNISKEAEWVKGGDETVYLGDGVVEERMLCGRMNGREVNISLDRLPMTVGKLANVSDFVINDVAVSKMHARFEEHDGRVYLCDLNSTNGTARNGVLLGVNQSVALEPGDRIRFGRTFFTYC